MNMDSLKLKVPPVVVAFIAVMLMKAVALITPGSAFLATLPTAIPYLIVILGFVVAISGVVEFRRHKTTVNPMLKTEATAMVDSGIYGYTRNPMYLGMLIALLAGMFYWSNFYTLLICPLFVLYMNRFQIEPEEAYLQEKFPHAFADYQSRVRRWL